MTTTFYFQEKSCQRVSAEALSAGIKVNKFFCGLWALTLLLYAGSKNSWKEWVGIVFPSGQIKMELVRSSFTNKQTQRMALSLND